MITVCLVITNHDINGQNNENVEKRVVRLSFLMKVFCRPNYTRRVILDFYTSLRCRYLQTRSFSRIRGLSHSMVIHQYQLYLRASIPSVDEMPVFHNVCV